MVSYHVACELVSSDEWVDELARFDEDRCPFGTRGTGEHLALGGAFDHVRPLALPARLFVHGPVFLLAVRAAVAGLLRETAGVKRETSLELGASSSRADVPGIVRRWRTRAARAPSSCTAGSGTRSSRTCRPRRPSPRRSRCSSAPRPSRQSAARSINVSRCVGLFLKLRRLPLRPGRRAAVEWRPNRGSVHAFGPLRTAAGGSRSRW